MVDVDGSGEIDKGELKGLAKMLGMQMSDKDLVTALPLIRSHRNNVDQHFVARAQDAAMEEMDDDGSGEVDFEEFAEWWTSQQAGGGCAMRAGIHFCLATKAA